MINNKSTKIIPKYGERNGYLPRDIQDFGDGGAFPEIHIKQYPLNMGRKNNNNNNTNVVPLKVDINGNVQYDQILREGMRKDQIVHSKYSDLKPKINITDEDLQKPSLKEAAKQLELTKLSIQNRLNDDNNKTNNEPQYIKYEPSNNITGLKTRMIKLYDMVVDPLEPPKYRHKKLPMRPPSPPVPIMHSPPRKITREDQKNWKIPPCISNWKNNKGFTMPLDQRLAADGYIINIFIYIYFVYF